MSDTDIQRRQQFTARQNDTADIGLRAGLRLQYRLDIITNQRENSARHVCLAKYYEDNLRH